MLPSLAAWESFYVIVGCSGAALTGLQFVTIALIADARRRSTTAELDAFATPTIVHFCATLVVAAVLSAPWHALSSAAYVLAASGAAGVCYTALVFRRARRQSGYRPVLEDWIFHTALPFVAYVLMLFAALALARVRYETAALFTIAATVVLLLFVGIHNAWDGVAYIAIERLGAPPAEGDRPTT